MEGESPKRLTRQIKYPQHRGSAFRRGSDYTRGAAAERGSDHTRGAAAERGSYGIILRCSSTDRYLIIQRRDTIEYMVFVRGRVPRYLYPVYFSRMTPAERNRLVTFTFAQMWEDLWINNTSRFYRVVYPDAKARFENVRDQVPALLAKYPSQVTEPSWGFPKGKLNGPSESPLRAAVREFEEETRIKLDGDRILTDVPPITETFAGTNGNIYSTTYFFAEIAEEPPIEYTTANRMRANTVSEEVATMKWVAAADLGQYLSERQMRDCRVPPRHHGPN